MVRVRSPLRSRNTSDESTTSAPHTGELVEMSRARPIIGDPTWSAMNVGRRSELFVDPRWYAVLSATYGLDFKHRSRGSSTLPFVEIDDPRGRRITSLPFCDFVDAPMDPADWNDLAAPLLAAGCPVLLETLEDHPATDDPRFESMVDGVHHIIPVAETVEEMMPSFATLTRRQIRRAERTGIRFDTTSDDADIAAVHALHVAVRKERHQLLAQPLAMFEQIKNQFGDDFCMVVGRRDGRIVGGTLLIRTATAWHYKFSVSHADSRADGVSHGAVAAALQLCIDTGVPFFDFGRSDLAHTGLLQFKRRFNPNEVRLACHGNAPLAPTQFGTDLAQLTNLFTRPDVPPAVTAEAGATLYRYFA